MLGMQSYLKVANQAKNDGTYIHGVYIILVILIAQKKNIRSRNRWQFLFLSSLNLHKLGYVLQHNIFFSEIEQKQLN